ncbi:MAG: hypothetical protein HGJ94_18480 [Desulfosarcina sp.]|nr:hypothetical protein [Desulfosarcina sp.]
MFLNPFKSNIYFDSCAFDGGSPEEQKSSVESRQIMKQSGNRIQILHSVQKEIDYPKTPGWVKREAMSSVSTKETTLDTDGIIKLRDIEKIIVGNGILERRKPDCRHVFETTRYGDYFITTDKGILKHSDIIFQKYHTYIMKPSELLKIILEYQNQHYKALQRTQ